MLNITVGLTGVGKTSVITKAQEHPDCPSFNTVNYGDVLLEIAQDEGLVETRDEITEIEPERYSELQGEVPHQIRERADNGFWVLDTHAALDTPTGYRPGLPAETIETLEPDSLIFIRAAPEEIVRRRVSDESRDRSVKLKSEIRQQQNVAINMASTDAVLAGCPLQLISNNDGKLEETAEEYADTLSELTD